MSTLDRRRYFAHCYGAGRERYFQSGKYFDAAGDAITTDAQDAEPIIPEVPAPEVAPEPAGEPTLEEKLKACSLDRLRQLITDAEGPAALAAATGKEARHPIIAWLLASHHAE